MHPSSCSLYNLSTGLLVPDPIAHRFFFPFIWRVCDRRVRLEPFPIPPALIYNAYTTNSPDLGEPIVSWIQTTFIDSFLIIQEVLKGNAGRFLVLHLLRPLYRLCRQHFQSFTTRTQNIPSSISSCDSQFSPRWSPASFWRALHLLHLSLSLPWHRGAMGR